MRCGCKSEMGTNVKSEPADTAPTVLKFDVSSPENINLEHFEARVNVCVMMIAQTAASITRTLDMALLMGSPIAGSPLTAVASLIHATARLNQPLSVRNPKNSACDHLPNWKDFRILYNMKMKDYKDLRRSEQPDASVFECVNCVSDLMARFEEESIAENPEKQASLMDYVEAASNCLCQGYRPPQHYFSEEPLPPSLFDPQHPSLRTPTMPCQPAYSSAADLHRGESYEG